METGSDFSLNFGQHGKRLHSFWVSTIIHHGRKSSQELKQVKNLKAGSDAETLEGKGASYWLVPHDLLSLLSQRTRDQQPRDGTTNEGLGPLP